MQPLLDLFGDEATLTQALFLLTAIGLALGFEFVNGFHDTANAVATVIYTNSLKPIVAVVWSGLWNLIGVLTSTGIVAFSIVALLPVELILNVGSGTGWAMVFSLLVGAIVWNVATWYFGLPASSSHTLIGSILGVGFVNAQFNQGGGFGAGINWTQAQNVLIALLISPAIGFIVAALLFLVAKHLLPQPELYAPPPEDQPPPVWIRAILILTCTGVSFAHGSNDGQKGMGLIMLILVGILPGLYALNLDVSSQTITQLMTQTRAIAPILQPYGPPFEASSESAMQELSQFLKTDALLTESTIPALAAIQQSVAAELTDGLTEVTSLTQLPPATRQTLRSQLYLTSATLTKLDRRHQLPSAIDPATLEAYQQASNALIQFIPIWVKVAVAIALGGGTLIGWKRIVVTVGEKIGSEHLTYAQGATAELVTMGTIILADSLGLPVSTTHVLSSGVAGTMKVNRSGLQGATVRNILLAWILTLPAAMVLGGGLFAIGQFVLSRWGLT